MKKIKLLDCTLRDGGYINNWAFGKATIEDIIFSLAHSKIDIIECGFIRRVNSNPDTTTFSSMEDLAKHIKQKKAGTKYAAMIECHNHIEDLIPENDGHGADIIRISFRKNDWNEAKEQIKKIMDKGYKVFVQPVGITNYNDKELKRLINEINDLKPDAFYVVDTLGLMNLKELKSRLYLVDKNLAQNIWLGFHSHNNLQMSFANAQELMFIANDKRKIIIDSSCFGIGRGAGNLPTELIVNYINKNLGNKYYLTPIMDIIDKHILSIYASNKWGYYLPYFISAISSCHPNYVAYLNEKEMLSINSIWKILSLIPDEKRGEFNAELIKHLYETYQSSEIDDSSALRELKERINKKEVLVLGSGSSIITQKKKISAMADGKYIIMVNFITDAFNPDAIFISNEKRTNNILKTDGRKLLTTSNIKTTKGLAFNYSSLLGNGDAADNSGVLLINLLKKVCVKKVYFAGFDGFDIDLSKNYVNDEYKKEMSYDVIKKKNQNIAKQLKISLEGIDYEFITKTKYKI